MAEQLPTLLPDVADAYLVQWEVDGQTLVEAHASYTPAADQATRRNGVIEGLYLAKSLLAPAQAALDEARDDRDSWCDQASARTADAVQFAIERDELRRELAEMTERRDNLHNTLHTQRDRSDAEDERLRREVERLTEEAKEIRARWNDAEAEFAREVEALRAPLGQRTAMMLGHHAQHEMHDGEWVCIRFNDATDALDFQKKLAAIDTARATGDGAKG